MENSPPKVANEERPRSVSPTPSCSSREDQVPSGQESVGEGEGEVVGQLLRATVEELESALKDTHRLLASRDEELAQLKQELDRYKQQAAKEIANKTRLAQALDQSQSHASQLEDLLQSWQLQLQESRVQEEKLQSALKIEQVKTQELETRLVLTQEMERELRTELDECRLELVRNKNKQHISHSDSPLIDAVQQRFLKQAIFYLLTDFHAEEQLRAIISILDFTAQERKSVYSKMQEKGGFYK